MKIYCSPKAVSRLSLLILFSVINIMHVTAQDADFTEHPVFDPYSVVDETKKAYGVADFNNMTAQEKEDFYDARIKANITEINNGLNVSCQNYSKKMQLTFTGLENFTQFVGTDDNNDGTKEGYDYYNPLVELQKENIPLYLIVDENIYGEAHMIVGAFIGSKDKNIKDNATDWNQWKFWDFRDGKSVIPGDEYMSKDGPCDMSQLIYYKPDNNFTPQQILNFDLNNGIAALAKDFGDPWDPQGYHPLLIKNNPHQSYIKLNAIDDKVFTKEEDIYFEEPQVESNVSQYSPTLERILSDTVVYDSKHYSFKVTDIGKLKMGRWNGNPNSPTFLENLVDSSSYIVDVDLATGIEELREENKGIDLDIMGNPVTSNTKFRVTSDKYLEKGQIYIFDITGKAIDIIDVNNLLPNQEKEIPYSGFESLVRGTYLVCFSANNTIATQLISK